MALIQYWYCEDCKDVFPRSDLKEVRVEQRCLWLEDRQTEVLYFYHCPSCGSELIDEAVYCEKCKEPFTPYELKDGLCIKCRQAK